jgi:hypothetical protein
MIKLAIKLVIFAAGIGAGIYISAHFPSLAGKVSSAEDAKVNAAVAQAKIDLLNQVVADQQAKSTPTNNLIAGASGMLGGGASAPDPTLAKYQAMLTQSKADLATANAAK